MTILALVDVGVRFLQDNPISGFTAINLGYFWSEAIKVFVL